MTDVYPSATNLSPRKVSREEVAEVNEKVREVEAELKAKHENEARVEKEVILSKMKEMEDRKKLKLSALEAEKKEKRQLEAQAINDQIKARNAAISST